MEGNFVKADIRYLPKVDAIMVGDFLKNNTDFNAAELRNVGKGISAVRNAVHRGLSSEATDLKAVLASLIPKEVERVKNFRKSHGSTKVGDVTVNMMYGGMRGINAMVYETSVVDPDEGIRFRGYSIPECQKLLPHAEGGYEPLPEGLFWLLATSSIPTKAQVEWVSKEWARRAELPPHVVNLLNNLPAQKVHPMSQFAAAITACNTESKFVEAYRKGINKNVYWEYIYEDAMDLIAKAPVMAAMIYKNTFKDGKSIGAIDANKDWSENFTRMLGYESKEFTELMRLYLTLHSDHEGGNVSSHAVHLVGSALSDPYLSFAAGMNGLAGPLHGLANQEVLIFISIMMAELGVHSIEEKVKEYCHKILKSSVIPGYGHAVLRKTDPRYIKLRDFAKKHISNDPMLNLVEHLYKVVPPILKATGRVKNPWPNVDAHSGVLLQYYGMKEMNYYTVLFGVSRALGSMAQLIWSRALGFPIERPKSFSTDGLMKMVGVTK